MANQSNQKKVDPKRSAAAKKAAATRKKNRAAAAQQQQPQPQQTPPPAPANNGFTVNRWLAVGVLTVLTLAFVAALSWGAKGEVENSQLQAELADTTSVEVTRVIEVEKPVEVPVEVEVTRVVTETITETETVVETVPDPEAAAAAAAAQADAETARQEADYATNLAAANEEIRAGELGNCSVLTEQEEDAAGEMVGVVAGYVCIPREVDPETGEALPQVVNVNEGGLFYMAFGSAVVNGQAIGAGELEGNILYAVGAEADGPVSDRNDLEQIEISGYVPGAIAIIVLYDVAPEDVQAIIADQVFNMATQAPNCGDGCFNGVHTWEWENGIATSVATFVPSLQEVGANN